MVDDTEEIIAGSSNTPTFISPLETDVSSHSSHLLGWPPSHFGSIPSLKVDEPSLTQFGSNVIPIKNSNFISSRSDVLFDEKRPCPLLLCWSAQEITISDASYLVLPPTRNDEGDTPTLWIDDGGFEHPSDTLFIRKSYEDITNLILEESSNYSLQERVRMSLSGTSGIGKSFFTRYFVWSLIHAGRAAEVPETILWANQQGGPNGCLYHRGQIYTVDDVPNLVASSAFKNLVDKKSAWLIFDGEPPQVVPRCRCLVISSLGNLFKDLPHVKWFRKSCSFRLYLPTWTLEELIEAARVVHGVKEQGDLDKITARYRRFGGIYRHVLQDTFTLGGPHLTDPIKYALNTVSVTTAIRQYDSVNVDATKTTGVLIHLIPDETYRAYKYEWGSTYIMEESFKQLFKVTKKRVRTFIVGVKKLHLDTFFGILFEPWFHAQISKRGYTGRMRRLTTGAELTAAKKKKRGFAKDSLGVVDHRIPRTNINHFHHPDEIIEDRYNIPDNPNFASVDSLFPSRGEMYQVTSAESHMIKTENLSRLRPVFMSWPAHYAKVKFIFVVPPHRFEEFTIQPYIEPSKKEDDTQAKTEKGKEVEGASQKSSKAARQKKLPPPPPELFDSTWIEQYVLEMDVNQLTESWEQWF